MYLKFIYFWQHWVFVAAHGLSLVAEGRGYSPVVVQGFSWWWLLLLQSTGSRAHGLQWFCHMWLVAPQHVESSRTGNRTHVPCTGRLILIHCSTREVLKSHY